MAEGGKIAYMGPANAAVNHFEQLGFKYEIGYNAADYLSMSQYSRYAAMTDDDIVDIVSDSGVDMNDLVDKARLQGISAPTSIINSFDSDDSELLNQSREKACVCNYYTKTHMLLVAI